MFYHACLAGGVSDREAKKLYWAVARFGPKWTYETRTKMATYTGPDGTAESFETYETVSVPISTDTATEEDLAWANEYFEKNDPPAQIIPLLKSRLREDR